MKKVTDDIAKAFDNCLEALSLHEFSRRTGIGIYTLRKFATRQTRNIREETWDKLYPVLKPYLIGEDASGEGVPVRIGNAYRRNHDIVDLISDQKVVLDCFEAIPVRERSKIITELNNEFGNSASCYELRALTADENRLLGIFDAMSPERKSEFLTTLVDSATAEVHRQRQDLF